MESKTSESKPIKAISQKRRASLALKPQQLAAVCPPSIFDFSSTEDVPPLEQGIIGQDRAVRAMEFGLKIKHPGYNLFISGPVGTGKTTYAQTRIRQVASKEPQPPDICYVYNFNNPDQPSCIILPPGRGAKLRREMEEMVEDIRTEIKRVFESEDWERRRSELVEEFEKATSARWEELDRSARALNFAIQRTPTGIFTIPLGPNGQPISPEEFGRFPEDVREDIAARNKELQSQVAETIRKVRNMEKEAREKLKQVERETALYAVGHLLNQMKDQCKDLPGVCEYLEKVQADVIEQLDRFRSDGDDEGVIPGLPMRGGQKDAWLTRYKVNLLVDNSETEGAPLVFETNPTYYNLFGKVEYRGDFGTLVTDFTMIKPGAIHMANGGYLVIQANDLFSNPMVWPALKRTLKTGQIRIENIGDQLGVVATTSLKPEPLPLKLKVIIIGNPLVYQLLYNHDEDFRKFFKVKVDFDVEMPRTEEHIKLYASFVSGFCQREGLRHLDPSAMSRIVDYSSRLADDQHKLSTRFHDVTELIFEASAWAEEEGSPLTSARHVNRAMEERVYRSNKIEEKILELFEENTIMVDTEGSVCGQVNGLAVLDFGDHSFGKPNRITARVFPGEKGVINIERETEMSGPIHSKGVYILNAHLAGKYSKDRPLALSASVCFEQLYEEIEGDSASSAELYALLSELSGLPVDQGIAVTGSVNQKGQIQPIGGVNEKIEGFFHVCKMKGLTGKQGVIIPHQNIRNLMLKEEVLDAVKNGMFHIYAVRTIDEGIELLTGVEAGAPREDGTFPEGTVNSLVDMRLAEMANALRHFEHEHEHENEEK